MRAIRRSYSTRIRESGTTAISIISVADVLFHIRKYAEIRGEVPLPFHNQELIASS